MLHTIPQQITQSQQNPIDILSRDFFNTDLDTHRKALEYVYGLSEGISNTFSHVLSFTLNDKLLYQSQKTIGKKVHRTRQTANEYLQKLFRDGVLIKIRGGFNRPNGYIVTPAFMTNEFLRSTKHKFKCAQVWFFKRMLSANLSISMLMEAPQYAQKLNKYGALEKADCIDDPTLKNSKYLYIKNIKQINSNAVDITCMRARGKLPVLKKNIKGNGVSVQKEVFEAMKKKGLVFSDGARVDLQIFQADVVLAAASEFVMSVARTAINNKWKFFLKLCHELTKAGSHPKNIGAAAALSAQYNIDEHAPRTLEYSAPVSDKHHNTSSKGKASDSGTKISNVSDAQGWEYGVAPDDTRIRTRKYDGDHRKFARNNIVTDEPSRLTEHADVESPANIKQRMLEYVISHEYNDHCHFWGKEHINKQVKHWLKIADYRARPPQDAVLDENGQFVFVNKIMAEILTNVPTLQPQEAHAIISNKNDQISKDIDKTIVTYQPPQKHSSWFEFYNVVSCNGKW